VVAPLVSVITATRSRHTDLEECVRQVRAQTYRPLEHVIVSDGPDPALRGLICVLEMEQVGLHDLRVPIVFQETGRCWSDEFTESDGAAAFQVAQLLGRGPLQMWLSDDETMTTDHVESLVDLLESQGVDFVFSQARWYTAPHIHPPQDRIIGSAPPTPASITNCLYRTALLDYGKFETHGGRGTDWNQVSAWLRAGASYAFLERVTFTHRADQIGGVNSNTKKQPLRGHGAWV
jgi:hypothetical protein